MTVSWARSVLVGKDAGIELFLHCQPGAKKTEIQGTYGDRLKIRLAAPPIEGRANEVLIAWLSKNLGIPSSKIEILSGDTGRQKRVWLNGVQLEKVLILAAT